MEDNYITMADELELTEDIEYFLNKAKNSIELALETKNPSICLPALRQADISIRSHQVYLQKEETENKQPSE